MAAREGADGGLMTTEHNADWTVKTLKSYFDAIHAEHRIALQTADEEREKAAAALREGLTYQIQAGDSGLRDHITNQIEQIRSALESSDRLELARIAQVEAQVDTAKELLAAAVDANKQAVVKAEQALGERLEGIPSEYVRRITFDKETEDVDKRIGMVERWQFKMMGAIALAVIFVPAITAVVVYLLTRTAIPTPTP